VRKSLLWWCLSTASTLLSVFFLFFGIELCLASYKLNHPHQFILTFFASNLIILISVAVLIGVVIKIICRLRNGASPSPDG
jgi:hypothetical protein